MITTIVLTVISVSIVQVIFVTVVKAAPIVR